MKSDLPSYLSSPGRVLNKGVLLRLLQGCRSSAVSIGERQAPSFPSSDVALPGVLRGSSFDDAKLQQ